MKKLDKLVLGSFVGPFAITFLVVVFIMLTQHMLKYFDDIIGKGLSWDIIGQLLFYFAIFMTPVAMPLAVLLSSLITFGNLGEHFELTAIKGSGISLVRTLRPLFFFILLLTGIAFYVNNNLVPKAALEAYSLLYDIRQKKPALDLREGEFYGGIPDISIKVDKRYDDGITLSGIMIYDHRRHDGNTDITIADSGKMYTILNDQYLKMELFNGYNYTEGQSSATGTARTRSKETLSRSSFDRSQIVYDLSSFQLARTDKKWFQSNRIMRNLSELNTDIDSLQKRMVMQKLTFYYDRIRYFRFYSGKDSLPPDLFAARLELDSVSKIARLARANQNRQAATEAFKENNRVNNRPATPKDKRPAGSAPEISADSARPHPTTMQQLDSVLARTPARQDYRQAAEQVRQAREGIHSNGGNVKNTASDIVIYQIQWHKIITNSLACIAMFLIGAPLGAIIKKGGLGVPFLVSIFFFIIFYLISMFGEKWARQDLISPFQGVWAADFILLIIGLVFLRQARADARLLESDFYSVLLDKLRTAWERRRKLAPTPQT